ncbi:hypothetical protein B0H13DRAFT_1461814, partial [Mycena leptocephala]
PHHRQINCGCSQCKSARDLGCSSPFRCMDESAKILECMHPKWDPRRVLHQPNRNLTAEELAENVAAL